MRFYFKKDGESMKTRYFIEVYINYKRNWSIRMVERTLDGEIKKVVWLASFINEELMNCELEFLRFQKLDENRKITHELNLILLN